MNGTQALPQGMPAGQMPQGGFPGGPPGMGGRGGMDGFGQMMRLIPGGPTTAIVLALIFLVTCVVLAIAFYKLYQKAGLSGPIGLLAIVPVVNMGIALYLAFAEWPLAKELAHAKLLAASVATPAVEAVGPTTPLVESAQPAEA